MISQIQKQIKNTPETQRDKQIRRSFILPSNKVSLDCEIRQKRVKNKIKSLFDE